MLDVFVSILPLFLVMALGMILRRARILEEDFVQKANQLVYRVCLPVLLFQKVSASAGGDSLPMKPVYAMSALIFVGFIAGFTFSTIIGESRRTAGTMTMNGFRGNFAYMGLPVSFYLFGNNGLAIASLYMAFLVPFVNSLAVISLAYGALREFRVRSFLRSTLLNPLFVACMLGLAAGWMHVPVPTPVDRGMSIIAQMTLPLALLCIGASLKLDRIGLDRPALWVGVFLKLILLPGLGWIWLMLRGGEIMPADRIMMVMLAAPSALVNFVMADSMDGDADLSTGIIVVTTLGSIFGYVCWMSLL